MTALLAADDEGRSRMQALAAVSAARVDDGRDAVRTVDLGSSRATT